MAQAALSLIASRGFIQNRMGIDLCADAFARSASGVLFAAHDIAL